MSNADAAQPSPEQIITMLPAIAQALEGAASNSGVAPTDMQSNIWNQAVHSR